MFSGKVSLKFTSDIYAWIKVDSPQDGVEIKNDLPAFGPASNPYFGKMIFLRS